MKDKISIIVPIYRSEKYIKECIESICNQSYRNYEVILVDNNSDDSSIIYATDVLDKYAIQYKVVTESNQGQSFAKNRGILESSGEWLCFIDSDDVVNPDYLYQLLKCAHETDSCVSFCSFSFDYLQVLHKYEQIKPEYKKYSRKEISDIFLKRKLLLIVPGMIVRKSLFDNYPFVMNNTEMKSGEDLWQIWMILAHVDHAGYFNQELYGYRRRDGSVTTHVDYYKVMSCHDGFETLRDKCKYKYTDSFLDMIIYREDFGLIRSTAQYSDYESFLKIRENLLTKRMYKRLKSFPDIRVLVFLIILRLFPHFFWIINHYWFKE